MIDVKVGFAAWQKQFQVSGNTIEKDCNKAIKKAATRLYTRIVSYTPVGDPKLWSYKAPKGYRPGTLKKSWKIDFLQNDITISNDQPYAQRVEDGWSTQAPTGMMKRALLEYPDLLKASVKG